MASTRNTRTLNKRFSKVHDESPTKDGGNLNKSKIRKRKLSDMLGSPWSKEELERFYEAFRRHGRDWKKVASVIRHRSVDMVEALFTMNKAYLSLPEGTASAAGLIAMMTDHYNILEGSDSERESDDGPEISRKPQKRNRGKFRLNNSKGLDGPFPDLLQYQAVSSSYGCLSLLKKKRSGGSRPRAVGKRTPRFPVSYLYDKDDRAKKMSLNKLDKKPEVDAAAADDDEGAHVAALALAEAFQRGGSPQVSRTPSRRMEHIRPSLVQNGERKHVESELSGSKFIATAIDEDYLEGSLGSREAENGDFARDSNYRPDTEGTGAVEIQRKVKKVQVKKLKAQAVEDNYFDDIREACSGTEEGLNLRAVEDEGETEVADEKIEQSSPHGPRKRSRQLFFRDESSDFDALQTLADISLHLAPGSAVESDSSVQVKEERRNFEKPNISKSTSANHQRDKPKISMSKEKAHPLRAGVDVSALKNANMGTDLSLDAGAISEIKLQPYLSTSKMRKRKRKLPAKLKNPKAEVHSNSCLNESQKTEAFQASADEAKKSMSKAKRISQIAPLPKQGKSVRPQDRSSSTDLGRIGTNLDDPTTNVSIINQVSLPTKLRSRRKMDLQKALAPKELRSSEDVGNDRPDKQSHTVHDRAIDLKDKLSHCLSSQMLRRWCAFEWFYSAIDYPWFARSEFVEYLNHVGLGHVPRLTRVEWGVIRSSLGKPRRLSKQFLLEEREKLELYRESVRKHYTELRAGIREGLATDLARPLSVGQRVIACHPKTREIHDGSVLTVDRNKCRVQFDRPELGVEFVMDIDCMPLNPLENMSEALRRQNIAFDKFRESFNDPKLDNQHKEWKTGGPIGVTSSENLENADGVSHVISSSYPMNTLMKQAKGDTIDAITQAKAAANEVVVTAQQAVYSQPCTLAQIQAREADIRALSELTRALDRKEALLVELRHMNDEILGSQKDEDSIKDLDYFRKQYATILLQLRDANEQVGNALLYLRQRNTYHGKSTPPWMKTIANLEGLVGPQSSIDHSTFLSQDSGSHVAEIVESSRQKARTMVDAAVQALSSLKEGEDAFARIGEAIDSPNNRQSGADLGISAVRSHTPPDTSRGSSACTNQDTSCTPEPTTTAHVPSPQRNNTSDRNEAQLPSELISSCVATLLMIQTCTERQYPPAEVAQILDSAVTSLQPCCSQNLSIYREIQLCMGMVKNQMLALIPTQSTILPTELSTV